MTQQVTNFNQMAENIISASDHLLKKSPKVFQKGLMYVDIDLKDVSKFNKCLSYLVAAVKSERPSETILEKRLFEYEQQLLQATEEVVIKKKLRDEKLKRRVTNVIANTIVPYYKGQFTINLSRQISFLPLDVRLLTYLVMYRNEQDEITKQHIMNRLGVTLEKLDEKMLVAAYACYNLLKNKRIPNAQIDSDLREALHPIGEIRQLREEIFQEQGLEDKEYMDELSYSISCFVNLENIHDEQSALLALKVFKSYYSDVTKINNYVKKIKAYIVEKDPSILKDIPVEFLDRMAPKYTFLDESGQKIDVDDQEKMNRLHESNLKASQKKEKQNFSNIKRKNKKTISQSEIVNRIQNSHPTVESVIQLFNEIVDCADNQIENSRSWLDRDIEMGKFDEKIKLKLHVLSIYVNSVEEGKYITKQQVHLLRQVVYIMLYLYQAKADLVRIYIELELHAKFARQAILQLENVYLSEVTFYAHDEMLVGWDGIYSEIEPSSIKFSYDGDIKEFIKQGFEPMLDEMKSNNKA